MTLREILRYLLLLLLYLALQILVLRNIVLFDYAFCFPYLAAVLLLPIESNRNTVLIVAFATGFLVDIFYNTLGMHAAATVLAAYLRYYFLSFQIDFKNADRLEISIRDMGIGSYLAYLFPLVLIHHSVLFFIEMSHFGMILYTLLRIIASSLFTTLIIVVIQLFSRR
jgi:rod shape-determining protein MreD